MTPDCPHTQEAAAFLAGELTASRMAVFTRHLDTCHPCRDEVAALRRLLETLHEAPAAPLSRDLAAETLARARDDTRAARRHRRVIQAVTAAAALVLATGLAWTFFPSRASRPAVLVAAPEIGEREQSLARALDWFCQHQEADGSWDAEKWGGNPRYQAALTALPLLALLEGPPTPQRTDAAHRAAQFLQSLQQPDGTFGAQFGASAFVQGISTCALLHACQAGIDDSFRQSADAAVRAILARQSPSGGWGADPAGEPLAAITLWHRDALALAVHLGWNDAAPALDRANAWLDTQPAVPESLSPLPHSTAPDFHRAYITAVTLRHSLSTEAQAHRHSIHRRLIDSQTRTGADAGSWEPTDQWSLAGGRLYSTALASLALQ